jgi:hypothetical protein
MNQVFINDHDVIEIIVDGDQTVKSVQAMGDDADKLITQQQKQGKRPLVLDNLTKMGKVPPEARKRVVEVGKAMRCEKLAMYGNNTMLKLGANLLLNATGRGNQVKYFDDYDKAIEWLHAENL